MIELLGVGVQDGQKLWRVRTVSARFQRGTLSAIVAGSPAEAAPLLDAVTGRRVPEEGRVWVTRLPLMRETQGRVRKLVGDATSTAMFVSHRSVLWNAEVAHQTRLGRVMRLPRRGTQQAALSALADVGLDRCASDPVGELSAGDRLRVALARVLARRPAALVLRDVDTALGAEEAVAVLGTVRRVARSHHLVAIVSLTSLELGRRYADRVLLLTDGALIADRRGLGAQPALAVELQGVAP